MNIDLKMAVCEASQAQHAAAIDENQAVRIVAGPGTGKSRVIEEHVIDLLKRGVHPSRITACSFTRAASQDLEKRIKECCEKNGFADSAELIHVSTLHALALRALKQQNLIGGLGEATVLSNSESQDLFDREFIEKSGLPGIDKKRAAKIREFFEASWQTGREDHPLYTPPDPEISVAEREAFKRFHGNRCRLYSCVLPGELVKECVELQELNDLDVAATLNIQHLIVDEYQDLNPVDQEFVESLIDREVSIFIAGDDDQSIYHFRYASPAGLQEFIDRHPEGKSHTLKWCFRCPSSILSTSQEFIEITQSDKRIAKQLESVMSYYQPPISGSIAIWEFALEQEECKAIAESCGEITKKFAEQKLPLPEILVLIARNAQLEGIAERLDELGIRFTSRCKDPDEEETGAFLKALLSLVVGKRKAVSLRRLLGLEKNCGTKTICEIADTISNTNLSYVQAFEGTRVLNFEKSNSQKAFDRVKQLYESVKGWNIEDLLCSRTSEIKKLAVDFLKHPDLFSEGFDNFVRNLPAETTLRDFLEWLSALDELERFTIEKRIWERAKGRTRKINQDKPNVRVITLHRAKGLNADFVFIPNLTSDKMPGRGNLNKLLICNECARQLYVGMTRARISCIMSYARRNRSKKTSHPYSQMKSPLLRNVHIQRQKRTGAFSPKEVNFLTEQAVQIQEFSHTLSEITRQNK